MALGAYDAVKELGLAVPDDISIVGYDDQEEIVRYMRPPLTTIRIPYYEMGEVAAANILDKNALTRQMLQCLPVMRGSLAGLNGKS
jgi:LacI family transcriptional regulator